MLFERRIKGHRSIFDSFESFLFDEGLGSLTTEDFSGSFPEQVITGREGYKMFYEIFWSKLGKRPFKLISEVVEFAFIRRVSCSLPNVSCSLIF